MNKSVIMIFLGLLLVAPLVISLAFGMYHRLFRIRSSEQEKLFRTAFDHAAMGMGIVSLKGSYLWVNRAFCRMLDYSKKELLNKPIKYFVDREDFSQALPYIQKLLNNELENYQILLRHFNKLGDIVFLTTVISLVRDNNCKPLFFVVQFQDTSSEKRSEQRLKHMAYHDPLTGLANRNSLEKTFSDFLINAKRKKSNFAVIILDLDHFKDVNDTVGHVVGDILLQTVGERLKNTVRSSDVVARIGGDEFVIVLNEAKSAMIVGQIAQKILYSLLKPILIKDRELYITTSIGISMYPYDGEDIETLLKNADLAMYRAKENGRNNYQFCTSEMTKKALEKIGRKNAMSHALIKNEFFLYYQPIIDVSTGHVVTIEALLRWESAEYGLVAPDSIISIAEEAGLIVPLSEWVLRTACYQVKQWQKQFNFPLKLAVNISARQFKNSDFVSTILSSIQVNDFPPDHLILEMTESLLMHNSDTSMEKISALKSAGLIIAIDNYGKGFSSFKHLSKYAVDIVKIDRSFMQDDSGTQNYAIVSGMISAIKKLGICTVAAGVETKEQHDALIVEGVDQIQGYFISKPLAANQMTNFFQEKVTVCDTSGLE